MEQKNVICYPCLDFGEHTTVTTSKGNTVKVCEPNLADMLWQSLKWFEHEISITTNNPYRIAYLLGCMEATEKLHNHLLGINGLCYTESVKTALTKSKEDK